MAGRKPLRGLVIGRFTSIHTHRFIEELRSQKLDVAGLWIGQAETTPAAPVYHAKQNMRLLGAPHTATLGCILYVRRAIRDFRPDIVHVQDDPRMPHWLSFTCPSSIKKAYTSWGHNPGLRKEKSFQRAIGSFDLLTSDAPDVLNEIAVYAPAARKEIIRFGADAERFSPGSPDGKVLQSYGLDPDGLYILSPRSLRPNYNQLTLIRALPPVISRFPNLKLILKHHHVANYADSETFEQLVFNEAEKLGVSDSIIRINHIPYDHLCHLYRLCRVAVSIPFEDGFPATIFEAMASGCALIVSNDPSYEGVVENGENAIAIAPDDVDALSTALIRILNDDAFANGLRQGGYKTVAEKGDFKNEISRLVKIYHQLF
jgi:glycosyltransferase involved in cell wall biosynthesis